MRKFPYYKKKGVSSKMTRCKHLKRAREFWLDAIILERNRHQ